MLKDGTPFREPIPRKRDGLLGPCLRLLRIESFRPHLAYLLHNTGRLIAVFRRVLLVNGFQLLRSEFQLVFTALMSEQDASVSPFEATLFHFFGKLCRPKAFRIQIVFGVALDVWRMIGAALDSIAELPDLRFQFALINGSCHGLDPEELIRL